jgi:hypothetical protein
MCSLANPTFKWFRSGEKAGEPGPEWDSITPIPNSEDSYACTVERFERFPSPSVCKSTPQYTDMKPDVMDH